MQQELQSGATLRLRLHAKPRTQEQAYGPAYWMLLGEDGTLAIVMSAKDHRDIGKLSVGDEIEISGKWTPTRLIPTHDAVFRVQEFAS